jgi:hypothetical protein
MDKSTIAYHDFSRPFDALRMKNRYDAFAPVIVGSRFGKPPSSDLVDRKENTTPCIWSRPLSRESNGSKRL